MNIFLLFKIWEGGGELAVDGSWVDFVCFDERSYVVFVLVFFWGIYFPVGLFSNIHIFLGCSFSFYDSP
jgi:hypothetical protein